MPRTTASNRSLSVAASFLNGSSRQRRAQLSQALRSDAACSMLLCAVARAYTVAQRHLQPPRPRALERRALQPVHGIELAGAPAAGVAPHAPQQLPERLAAASAQRGSHRLRVGGHLRAAHLVHRIDGHRDDVKAVVADLRLGQRQRHALGVGRAHVHAHVPHLGGIAAMGLQISSANSTTVRCSRPSVANSSRLRSRSCTTVM